MKQVLKSIKRKYLVGGIAAFAGVSLLTTGVATWVIGSNSSAEKEVTVDVEGLKNNTASVTIGSASNLTVGETKIVTDGFVKVTVTEASTNNMKITLSNVKYSFGNGFTASKVGLRLATDYSYNKNTHSPESSSGNLVPDSASKVTRSVAKDAKLKNNDESFTAWQYITVQETIDDIGAKTSDGNKAGIEHTIASLDVTFSWGSFFNNQAPSAYYNSKELNLSTAADANNVENELTAMQTALEEKGIKITAELIAQ